MPSAQSGVVDLRVGTALNPVDTGGGTGGGARFRYQSYYAGNDIEAQAPDEEFQALPRFLLDYLRKPLDPGLGDPSPLYNGVVGSCYPVTVSNVVSTIAAVENNKRAYIIVQNLGPGNLWLNWGAGAAINFCLKFVPGQAYEPQIAGYKGTNCPIRNSLNLIADLANTTAIVGEATWVPKGIF